MNRGENRGDNPSPPVVEVQLLNIPDKGHIEVCFLGIWRSCITHWYRGRSWYCPGGESCDRTVHKNPPIWKAFAPVEVSHRLPVACFIPAVLEVSERLAICLGEANHRGEVWKLYRRPGRRDRHECWGDLIGTRPSSDLPTNVDVTRVVRRLGRAIQIEWDVPMPFEAPQILSARQADFTSVTPATPAPPATPAESKAPRKPMRELFEAEMKKQASQNGNGAK
jgi:hypothetical protein